MTFFRFSSHFRRGNPANSMNVLRARLFSGRTTVQRPGLERARASASSPAHLTDAWATAPRSHHLTQRAEQVAVCAARHCPMQAVLGLVPRARSPTARPRGATSAGRRPGPLSSHHPSPQQMVQSSISMFCTSSSRRKMVIITKMPLIRNILTVSVLVHSIALVP